MSGKFKIAAIAVFTAIIGLASSSSLAATATPTVNSGDEINGWIITFPQNGGAQGNIGLVHDVNANTSNVTLEKGATFTNTGSLLINFLRDPSATSAASTITITNEVIANLTGQNWTGFAFSILGVGPAFEAGHAFIPPSGANYDYTGVSVGATEIDYSGFQKNVSSSMWNQPPFFDANGDLIIDTNGALSFSFKETPLVSVPLPAAAWTGLSGLAGLALVAFGKKRILA